MADSFSLYAYHHATQLHLAKIGCIRNAVRCVDKSLPGRVMHIVPMTVVLDAETPCKASWSPERPGGERIMFVGNKIFEENRLYPGQDTVYGEGHRGRRGLADQLLDASIVSFVGGLVPVPFRNPRQTLRGSAAIVHELGHFLHAASSPNLFWALKTNGAGEVVPAHIGMQVSGYATINPLEFVAEVFTGRVFGMRYSGAVVDQYHAYGGFEF